jgi:predicted NBD/HSP70 family sugar kinase
VNLDDMLARLCDNSGDDARFDVEAGKRELFSRLRRLEEDPAEAQRTDDIAELIERADDDCQMGYAALQRQDFRTAEHYLRRAAKSGNDEAAYWLGLLLQLRSDQLRLMGQREDADDLAAEAARWRFSAQESGVAEALDAASGTGFTPPVAPPPAGSGSSTQIPGESGAAERAATVPSAATRYSVGVELRPYRFTAVLIDETGTCLAQTRRDLPDMEPGAVVRTVAQTVKEMAAEELGSQLPSDRITLGLQLGGPVDTRNGVVHFLSKSQPHFSREFKWEETPLGDLLRRETGFKVIILNDADAFAERERWVGAGSTTSDFAVMLIREGVGASVVKDGNVFPGPVELGNFIIHTDSLRLSDAGHFGALESTAGTTGIMESVEERINQRPADIEAAAALAEEDSRVEDAFTAAGIATACGISYLIGFAAPSRLVLYAPADMIDSSQRAGKAYLKQVTKFSDLVAFRAFQGCELITQPLGPWDGAEGAALAALRRCLGIEPATFSVDAGSSDAGSRK